MDYFFHSYYSELFYAYGFPKILVPVSVALTVLAMVCAFYKRAIVAVWFGLAAWFVFLAFCWMNANELELPPSAWSSRDAQGWLHLNSFVAHTVENVLSYASILIGFDILLLGVLVIRQSREVRRWLVPVFILALGSLVTLEYFRYHIRVITTVAPLVVSGGTL